MGPRCVVVGHVTRDLVGRTARVGGTACYAALTASRLGWPVGVVTSAGPGWDAARHLPGVEVTVVPAQKTTTFRNTYHGAGRTQRLYAVADPLGAEHVPARWREASVVLLAPVAQEVGPMVASAFPRALRGAVLQGWLRQWGPDGLVRPRRCSPQDLLGHLDAAVLSGGEVPDGEWLASLRRCVPLVAVTEGARGSTLYQGSVELHVRAFPRPEVDPTGAGDVYAAAFLVRYWESGDPQESALFASAAASFCVEAPGVANLPTRQQVERRLTGME